MRHLIDKEVGVMTLLPESEADRMLLYHLMNCSDLREFSVYLKLSHSEYTPLTVDLNISVDEATSYLEEQQEQHAHRTARQGTALEGGRLIGFNRTG